MLVTVKKIKSITLNVWCSASASSLVIILHALEESLIKSYTNYCNFLFSDLHRNT